MVSLKLAKEIKTISEEKGFKLPGSEKYWWLANRGNRGENWEVSSYKPTISTLDDECFAAYTTDELLEILKTSEHFESLTVVKTKEGYEWKIRGYNYPTNGTNTLSEALGKLYKRLIKEGLIK